jgi:hypothetical protein
MMSTPIDPAAVRKAVVNMNDLTLDSPLDPELQARVNGHFPTVLDAWEASGDVDPYGTLADEDRWFVPDGVSVTRDRADDIRSAYCHTIRNAIKHVYGQDPSSSGNDLTF